MQSTIINKLRSWKKKNGQAEFRKEEILQGLYETYEKNGEPDKAFNYLKEYNQKKEQAYKSELGDNIKYAENSLEREKAKNQAIQTAESEKRQKWMSILIAGLITVFLLGLALFLNQRQKTLRKEKEVNIAEIENQKLVN